MAYANNKDSKRTDVYRAHNSSGRSWLLGKERKFFNNMCIFPTSYFHILAVRMSKPNTFEEELEIHLLS